MTNLLPLNTTSFPSSPITPEKLVVSIAKSPVVTKFELFLYQLVFPRIPSFIKPTDCPFPRYCVPALRKHQCVISVEADNGFHILGLCGIRPANIAIRNGLASRR